MKTLADRIAEFKHQGYTVFEGAFSRDLMDRWIAKYPDLVARQTPQGAANPTLWLSSVVEYEPWLMLPAVNDPVILDFAERVLGPFVQLDNLTFMAFPSLPRAEAEGKAGGWHRDIWGWVPTGADYVPPLACNAITYLQDLTDENGPLRVVAGSHRDPITVPQELRTTPHAREQLVYAKAGDVIFTHCALLHAGTPNMSGRERYFFSIYYNRSWLRHRDNHSGPNVARIIQMAREKNDRRLLRLFGVDELVFRRANSGFQVADEEMWDRWIEEDRAALQAGA
ncbi:MAG: phytanoyl-CoA dioxygenase family protein [Candidatus Latescibacteria bacterium]|nr:phytanoyl-CoA dioxygenase family protein [Candidatus Latescibacterota bacterium]